MTTDSRRTTQIVFRVSSVQALRDRLVEIARNAVTDGLENSSSLADEVENLGSHVSEIYDKAQRAKENAEEAMSDAEEVESLASSLEDTVNDVARQVHDWEPDTSGLANSITEKLVNLFAVEESVPLARTEEDTAVFDSLGSILYEMTVSVAKMKSSIDEIISLIDARSLSVYRDEAKSPTTSDEERMNNATKKLMEVFNDDKE